MPGCGPGLDFMMATFPLNEVFEMVFNGSGECANVDWSFLSFSMPAWVIICSLFMEWFGLNGFFVFLLLIHAFIGFFGIYRMSKRVKPTDLESQYSPLPRNISSAGMEMNPKIEVVEKD